MLSAADHAIRETGIGASEAAALLDLDPYRGPIDVWLRKRTPLRGPIVPANDMSPAAAIGHAIEPVIRQIYIERTGIFVAPTATTRHPDFPSILATADGLGERSGLEIKVVGSNMAHHWGDAGDPAGIPDYVLTQVGQNMAVFDRDRWDVAALVGGTDLRFWTVERDADLEESILVSDLDFWERYVEQDECPPLTDRKRVRDYMRKRYPGSTATKCRDMGNAPDVAEMMRRLGAAKEALALAEQARDEAEGALCALVGDDYGIEGIEGKFLWYPVQGRVDWKAVAAELAGGEGNIPAALMDRHRGEGYRVPRLYPAKDKGARNGSKGRGRRS